MSTTGPEKETKSKVDNEQAAVPGKMSIWKASALIACCTLAMMNNISTGVAINVALPTIGKELKVPESDLQWVLSAYSLTSGCFLILFGRLADLHGRKTVFLFGTGWLGIWALGCGFAQNVISLDIMRALQGLGAAAAIPSALGILAHAFPPSTRRTIAFATFSSGAPMGSAFGNIIGSLLTQYSAVTWRAAFYFTTGASVLNVLIGWFVIEKDTHHLDPDLDRRVDWLGAGMITAGLVLFNFSLAQGEAAPQGWKTPYIIVLLILSILLVGIFIYTEHYIETRTSRPPLIRLNLFTRAKGKFAVMLTVAFFNWAGFSSWIYYATLYYQSYLGLSPVHSMLRMLPMSVTGITCNVIVAVAVARISGVFLVAIGCIMTGLAPLLFALMKPSAPYWAFGFPAAIVSVVGADFIFASGSLFVAKVALPHEQSLAGGLFSTLTQIGTAFGLSLSTVVLDQTISKKYRQLGMVYDPRQNGDIIKPALLAGYRAAQWLNFGFVMFALALTVIFLRGIGRIGHRRTKAEKEGNEPEMEAGAEVSRTTTMVLGEDDGEKREV